MFLPACTNISAENSVAEFGRLAVELQKLREMVDTEQADIATAGIVVAGTLLGRKNPGHSLVGLD